jgi:hypothetical protein
VTGAGANVGANFLSEAAMTKNSENKLKPATPMAPQVKPSDGPTFVAQWSDGVTTRMTTYTMLKKLDLKRGLALSRAAYSSRKKVSMATIEATIIGAHFEKDDAVVHVYAAAQLKG